MTNNQLEQVDDKLQDWLWSLFVGYLIQNWLLIHVEAISISYLALFYTHQGHSISKL